MLCVLPWLLLLAGGNGKAAKEGPCTDFSSAISNATSTSNTADRHTTAVTSLLTIINRLAWTDVILVSDEDGEFWGGSERLRASNSIGFRKFVDFHSSVAWQPQGLPAIVSLGPGGATQSLDIVLVCSLACVTSVLDGAREFENRWKSQTALREQSRWLVHPTDVSSPGWLDLSNVTMNNVAVLVLERPSDPALSPRDFSVKASLYTLRWTAQGRQLEMVEEHQEADCTAAATSVFPNLQLGLNGKLLRVGMRLNVRFTKQQMDDGTTVYDGSFLDLLLLLAEYLNFTYEMVLDEDISVGLPMDNGSWTGLIGMLQRREIDTVVLPFHHTLIRSLVVDFSSPLQCWTDTFMYRQPGPRSIGFLTYFKPFRLEVIGCIFLATLLTAVFMTALDFSSSCGDARDSFTSEVTGQASLSPSREGRLKSPFGLFLRRLRFTFRALYLNEQEKNHTKSSSGRVMVACWWLFCVVMAAVYTGNLVAFLAVPQNAFPISSLEDLVSQTQYKWGTIGSAATHQSFMDSNVSIDRKVRQGMETFALENPDVLSSHDVVHVWKVPHEDYVMLLPSQAAEEWMYRYCNLSINSKGYRSGFSSIPFQKNSAYEPVFSKMIDRIRDSGLWDEMTKKSRMLGGPPCVPSSSSTTERPAAMVDVQGALYVLLAGAAIAGAVLLGELLTNRIWPRQTRTEDRQGTPTPALQPQ